MATKPQNPADWFGTFLDSVGKISNPRAGADDLSNRILLALKSGALPPSVLVSLAESSVTVLNDALAPLEKLGLIRYEDSPDGKRIVLTGDGARAVANLAADSTGSAGAA